ncbi:MAG: tetratricopeptide repeat protein [Thermodesulfovibrionales bacterium]
MLRVAVYSSLVCLTILTLYVRYSQNPTQGQEETAVAGQTSPSAPSNQHQPPPLDIQPLSDISPLEVNLGAPSLAVDPQIIPGNKELASKALEKFRSGDYEEAAGLFKELAETDKSALSAVGKSYFRLGKYQAANEYFEKAIESDSHDFVARKALAFSYYKLDNLEKSIEHAGKGLSLVSDPELQGLFERLRKEKNTQGNFIEESTAHFKVLFDGYEHGKIAREVISILEDAYRFVGKELDHFPDGPVTVVLNTNSDFFDTTGAPHWAGGIYDGKIRIPVRGAERQGNLLRKVLFHEYTHAVVGSITQRCPRWIDEGLAEYFSAPNQQNIGQFIPLRNIENSFLGLSSRNVPIAYQESYSAVSYLIEKYGMHRMKKMLVSLSQGSDPDQAFSNAFSKSYADFIREWGKT